MINFKEKGIGLHEAIKQAGYSLWHEDRVVYSSNDAAVQVIIDNYDPLPVARSEAKKRLVKQFNDIMAGLEGEYPEVEKRTFTKQEAEARNYLIDPGTLMTVLAPIATARGITLTELSSKVVLKVDEYTALTANLIGQRQAKDDVIDASTDWKSIEGINL